MASLNVLVFFFLATIVLAEQDKNPRCTPTGLRCCDLPRRIETLAPYSYPVVFDKPNQVVLENNPNVCGGCCGSNLPPLCKPQTLSLSPGAAGAPSPCGETYLVPTSQNTRVTRTVYNMPCGKNQTVCANQLLSPLIYEPCVQYMMDFLRRHYWIIHCPQFNWFYDPDVNLGESPCQQVKFYNSGIDVTLFRPDSSEPICTTTKNIADFRIFAATNANSCGGLREENYMETATRVAYALNIVNSSGQLRTVVLSKAKDEFPPGYACRLLSNPCNPFDN